MFTLVSGQVGKPFPFVLQQKMDVSLFVPGRQVFYTRTTLEWVGAIFAPNHLLCCEFGNHLTHYLSLLCAC